MAEVRATIDITVAGETRPVEFSYYVYGNGQESNAFTGQVFTGHIGRGTKAHQCSASLHHFESEDEARRMGYVPGKTFRQASDGRWYGIRLGDTVLNRQCRITGWANVQKHSSHHIMERAWQEGKL